MMNKKYHLVAIGGTFDRLHKGHEYFISKAFELGEKVLIGLTSDDFTSKKTKNQKSRIKINIQSYIKRKSELNQYLEEKRLKNRVNIVQIDDIYGPAVDNGQIQALLVTKDTLAGGKKVNEKRVKRGFTQVDLIKIDLLLAEDEKKISSSRVRRGVIDRWGRVFSKYTVFEKPVVKNLRLSLKSPLGDLIKGDPKNPDELASELTKAIKRLRPTIICTVGDIATLVANHLSIPINLAIVDFKVNRKEKYSCFSEVDFKSRKYAWLHDQGDGAGSALCC